MNNDHLAPPWKAVYFPNGIDGIWCVTTDRGDPSKEYDVNEDPPEWAAKLQAAAPKLFELCKKIVKKYNKVQYFPHQEVSPLLGAVDEEVKEISDFLKELNL